VKRLAAAGALIMAVAAMSDCPTTDAGDDVRGKFPREIWE